MTDPEAVRGAAEGVGEAARWLGLAGLVNNAGTAIGGPLALQPLGEVQDALRGQRGRFDLGDPGLLAAAGYGEAVGGGAWKILNVGSTGGKIALPFIGAYAGTKHAVEGISDSLRRELLPYGIDVILIEPGAVRTEIWDKGASQAGRYKGTDYAEPLDNFRRYAEGLAKSGYSPEEFGRLRPQSVREEEAEDQVRYRARQVGQLHPPEAPARPLARPAHRQKRGSLRTLGEQARGRQADGENQDGADDRGVDEYLKRRVPGLRPNTVFRASFV